jgi:hypothetical protein
MAMTRSPMAMAVAEKLFWGVGRIESVIVEEVGYSS